MAATSYHQGTGRWLTSLGADAREGDTPCLSIGCPMGESQFTTYQLAAPVAHSERGEPLFDLDEARIGYAGEFYTRAQLAALMTGVYGIYIRYGARLQRPYRPDSAPHLNWAFVRRYGEGV